jgi:hypothetical protein
MDDHYTELSLPDKLRLAAAAAQRAGVHRRHYDAIHQAADILEELAAALDEPEPAEQPRPQT